MYNVYDDFWIQKVIEFNHLHQAAGLNMAFSEIHVRSLQVTSFWLLVEFVECRAAPRFQIFNEVTQFSTQTDGTCSMSWSNWWIARKFHFSGLFQQCLCCPSSISSTLHCCVPADWLAPFLISERGLLPFVWCRTFFCEVRVKPRSWPQDLINFKSDSMTCAVSEQLITNWVCSLVILDLNANYNDCCSV